MKTIHNLSFLFLSWVLYACTPGNGKNMDDLSQKSIPVKLKPLLRTEISQNISTSGQFSTDDETYLAFKTGGIIRKILVKEGDAIHEGQLLATLDLTEVNAGVSQAELGFEKASRDFDRVTNLYADSVATLEQLQNARTALDLAKHQLAAAQFNQRHSEIRGIADGFVLKKMANEGQVITAGAAVLETNGGKEDSWVLKAGVGDREWARIALGDSADVTLDALPNHSFPAVVVRRAEGTDAYTGAFAIELKLTGRQSPRLASGLFGAAVIHPSRKESGWLIPYEAILDGDAASGYVFVSNDDQTVQKIKVKIGDIMRDQVIVTSGLENAKDLVISGSAYLADGSPIRIADSVNTK